MWKRIHVPRHELSDRVCFIHFGSRPLTDGICFASWWHSTLNPKPQTLNRGAVVVCCFSLRADAQARTDCALVPWFLVGNEGMRAPYKYMYIYIYIHIYVYPLRDHIGYLVPSFPTKSQPFFAASAGNATASLWFLKWPTFARHTASVPPFSSVRTAENLAMPNICMYISLSLSLSLCVQPAWVSYCKKCNISKVDCIDFRF